MVKSTTDQKVCSETMPSGSQPGHMHTCMGSHEDGFHFCAECLRWWWRRED